jgi:hypothetical protein
LYTETKESCPSRENPAAQACRAQSENIITATERSPSPAPAAGAGRAGALCHMHAPEFLIVLVVRASLQLGAKRLQAFFQKQKD